MSKQNFISLPAISAFLFCMVGLFCLNLPAVHGQLKEPDIKAADDALTPFEAGVNDRIGGSFFINNFGVAVEGIYARAVGPYTEITFSIGITGIRDASAQKTFAPLSRRRVVPNKYKRAIGFPVKAGIKHRLFPNVIADNFRFYLSASAGPAFAFTYPYFKDVDENGYRTTVCAEGRPGECLDVNPGPAVRFPQAYIEEGYDFFTGWSEGEGHWGFSGDIAIGADLGSDFDNQITFEIGYFFYYFPNGLQIMEPFRNTDFNSLGISTGQEPFYEAQKYFGTPQIKLTYSWW